MVLVGLDGVDGAGKSTLAEAVRAELERQFPGDKVELLHRGPPEQPVLEEYATSVEHVTHHLVLDRWHFGELVYAPLYRGTESYGALGVAGFRWVEKFLQARGGVMHVVDLPLEVVEARLRTRGEDYLQARDVPTVLERFREVRELSAITAPAFTPPTTFDGLPELVRDIVQDAVENARDHAPLRDFPSYVGGIRPSTLLVGERRGGKPPYASQACFGPVKNRSGEFLWAALPDPFWKGVGAANAYEDDVAALWQVLGTPGVVALGREASRALDLSGIPHNQVPHPAHVKRFHNKKQTEYGELIAYVAVTGESYASWPN